MHQHQHKDQGSKWDEQDKLQLQQLSSSASTASTSGMSNRTVPHTIPTTVSQSQDDADDDDDSISMVCEISETETSSSVIEQTSTQEELNGGTQHTNLTNAVVYYVCADNRPFAAVEGRGFRYLMKKAAPLYQVPSRETIKRKMEEKYEFVSAAFKSKLANIKHLSITFDIWSEMMSTPRNHSAFH
ncbi:hypothetical protein HHI36_011799 [Cryptolaemus montrouzieri]|uniref:Uncharacterized protein n=1 Tax=Cryptolaemus montrouzieri TaxID=559131 RepID=A0ABD2ND26_9CUCU